VTVVIDHVIDIAVEISFSDISEESTDCRLISPSLCGKPHPILARSIVGSEGVELQQLARRTLPCQQL